MDWNERFERLTAPQKLGLAAAVAERVLPLAGRLAPLEDGLRLVWLQLGGRATTKQELARALNAAIEVARARPDGGASADASQAVFDVLEAALHNAEATAQAIESAHAAVRTFGETAIREELEWLDWALTAAATTETPIRATFQSSSAPAPRWINEQSRANLPLFGPHG